MPPPRTEVQGIKRVDEFKYLGIQFDDCINFKPLIKAKKDLLRSFKQKIVMTLTCRLPS